MIDAHNLVEMGIDVFGKAIESDFGLKIEDIEKVVNGFSNQVYKAKLDGKTVFIRINKDPRVFPVEMLGYKAIAGQGIPVPEILACQEKPPLIGYPTMVMTAAEGAREYKQFWEQEGQRITEAWQQITGLPFEDNEVKVIVFNKPSYSGNYGEPMHLRYSYPPDIKKGTLIHELGHRLLRSLVRSQKEYDPHQVLDLVLYDLWVDLYGGDFAKANVEWEKKLKGLYDYEKTWDWALAMPQEEREKIFAKLKSKNQEVREAELEKSQNVYSLPLPEGTKIDHITKDNESHQGPFKGAQDFGVELGTQVLAPLEGTVVRVIDEHDKHGQTREFIQFSNVINIEHPNGEFSELVHLAKGSTKIKVGDQVTEGQELAETGLSGWMTEPHLHWLVFRKDTTLPRGFKGLEVRLRAPKHR